MRAGEHDAIQVAIQFFKCRWPPTPWLRQRDRICWPAKIWLLFENNNYEFLLRALSVQRAMHFSGTFWRFLFFFNGRISTFKILRNFDPMMSIRCLKEPAYGSTDELSRQEKYSITNTKYNLWKMTSFRASNLRN